MRKNLSQFRVNYKTNDESEDKHVRKWLTVSCQVGKARIVEGKVLLSVL